MSKSSDGSNASDPTECGLSSFRAYLFAICSGTIDGDCGLWREGSSLGVDGLCLWLEPTRQQIGNGTMNENGPAVQQRRLSAREKGGGTGISSAASLHLLRSMIVAVFPLIVVLVGITGYLEKWLWMRQLDYTGIFWTLLSVRWVMLCSAFVFGFLFLWINLRQAAKNSDSFRGDSQAWRLAIDADTQPTIALSPSLLNAAVVLISAGIALFFSVSFYAEWDTYLRFRYGGPQEKAP
ncbi:MAG: UPF0182 family protein [Xanthobacteraceae bacterium]